MYMYVQGVCMYIQCIYMVYTQSVNIYTRFDNVHAMYVIGTYIVSRNTVETHTLYNQLFHQVFGADTEMQYAAISHSPPVQGKTRMGAVPVQKMANFLMQGQTQLKQRRPSASL